MWPKATLGGSIDRQNRPEEQEDAKEVGNVQDLYLSFTSAVSFNKALTVYYLYMLIYNQYGVVSLQSAASHHMSPGRGLCRYVCVCNVFAAVINLINYSAASPGRSSSTLPFVHSMFIFSFLRVSWRLKRLMESH